MNWKARELSRQGLDHCCLSEFARRCLANWRNALWICQVELAHIPEITNREATAELAGKSCSKLIQKLLAILRTVGPLLFLIDNAAANLVVRIDLKQVNAAGTTEWISGLCSLQPPNALQNLGALGIEPGHLRRIQSIFLNAYSFIIEGLPCDWQARGGQGIWFGKSRLSNIRVQIRVQTSVWLVYRKFR